MNKLKLKTHLTIALVAAGLVVWTAVAFAKDYACYSGDFREFCLPKGETQIQRIHSFVQRNGNIDMFDSLDFMYRYAVAQGIDSALPVCIAFADSGLGRELLTPYNQGNVGNTDSGNKVGFKSWEEGWVRLIDTLNNKYLWGYSHIEQLSRYGNKDGFVYATSPVNWHNNVKNCLEAVKGAELPDNWSFRT